jgi:putative NADH-flavin reductase
MKIAVIAASGRSGKIFVEQALAAGHSVRAGVHRTNNLTPHERLEIVSCDATNASDLTRLLGGQDAVVSLIGHVKGSPPRVQTDAMRTAVNVMQQLGLKRVVSLTGTGVRFPGDKITLVDRILNLGISTIDPARVEDGREHVQVLKQSNLDWTVIRVLKLQSTKPRPFALRAQGPTKWYVGRQEVAQSILQVLETNSFIKQAPIIGQAERKQRPNDN